MRRFMLAASALGALTAAPTIASAQYYATPYGTPGIVVTPPAAPMVQGQVYLAPGQTYVQPGVSYPDGAIYMNGERYYRDCWWDWGQRRCELKHWW
jgi:hypothetical protein